MSPIRIVHLPCLGNGSSGSSSGSVGHASGSSKRGYDGEPKLQDLSKNAAPVTNGKGPARGDAMDVRGGGDLNR